ncbi:MAG: aspartate carbamoyltransferase catalytic subunit [bacterium]
MTEVATMPVMSAPQPPVLPLAAERGLRHCAQIADCSPDLLERLFLRARAHQEALDRRQVVPTLSGLLAINCFLEPSTRTRVSFEAAEQRLGMRTITIGAADSSMAKGESGEDTRRTLESYAPDVIVVRSKEDRLPQGWASRSRCSIINGGDGTTEHPTQALYDRYTIEEAFGDHRDRNILFVGDILHSRVVGSHVALAAMLGTRVFCAGPAEWTDVAAKFRAYPGVIEVVELDAFLPHADVVNPLRVQFERGAGESISLTEYCAGWQINEARLRRAKPSAIVMHPAPVNRDVEISGGVVDSPRSWIQRQGGNGQAVRMAILEWCLGIDL